MKKRLLFAFMAMCVAVSGFALTNGEYVYTPQGRFQITSDLKAYSNFTDFSGWEAVTATEGTMVQDIFTLDANGPVAGTGCAVSSNGTAGEGMYFKFVPTDPNEAYVVSFKLKGVAQASVRVGSGSLNQNVVKVEGNSDETYGGTTEVLLCNRGEELTEDWQTFNYAIVGDGTARTYFISFVSMQTNVYIADLQIAEALQVADLRQRDAMVEKINAYKNVYPWPEDVLEEQGINEVLGTLNEIGDQSAQTTLNEALALADETLTEFVNQNMDDYLANNSLNHLNVWPGTKTQKASKAGEWTCLPSGRGFWENEGQGAWDMGHYSGSSKWGTTAYGVTLQKELIPGSYVFTIDGYAALRETSSSSMWGMNQGLKVGVATAYIVKVPAEGAEATAADTLGVVVKALDAVDYTTSIVAVEVKESGTYEIGYKVVPREDLQSLTRGGVAYVKNAYLYGKNESQYNQKQLAYEADVREQIAKGREELTNAANNIANAEKPWGKAELQACVDTIAPKIEGYEAWTQDQIIATYDEYYDHENRTKDDNGIMVYEVYTEAVKDIIAANKTFTAVNDTLASMQTAIDNAENTMAMRIYDAATGKDALKAAIAKAKETQAAMKAAQYSVENAAAIVTANAELADAVELFKTTIPATEEIISIDFENAAVQNAESLLYEIAGNNTVMTFSTFSPVTQSGDYFEFEQGIDSNGEKLLPGVLRVGNGTGDATFAARDYGTNILRVSMDWWFGRLSGRKAGFYLYDESGDAVAGLYFEPYNGSLAATYDSFKISSLGSYFVANTAGDAAACADNNKTHIECILDYGEKSMYLTSTTPNGTFTSDKVSFAGGIPVKFTVQSGYNYAQARRCWFDNLKIEMIQAGATDPFVGIENAKAADAKEAPVKVFENGQIIIGGKYNAAGAVVK